MREENRKSLAEIYARIPRVSPCKPGCHDCCGPIAMSRVEYGRLTGKRLSTSQPPIVASSTGDCPYVSPVDGCCTKYEQRPAICRLYGTVEGMRCPRGCVPERWLTDAEARQILAEVEEAR